MPHAWLVTKICDCRSCHFYKVDDSIPLMQLYMSIYIYIDTHVFSFLNIPKPLNSISPQPSAVSISVSLTSTPVLLPYLMTTWIYYWDLIGEKKERCQQQPLFFTYISLKSFLLCASTPWSPRGFLSLLTIPSLAISFQRNASFRGIKAKD